VAKTEVAITAISYSNLVPRFHFSGREHVVDPAVENSAKQSLFRRQQPLPYARHPRLLWNRKFITSTGQYIILIRVPPANRGPSSPMLMLPLKVNPPRSAHDPNSTCSTEGVSIMKRFVHHPPVASSHLCSYTLGRPQSSRDYSLLG
jgi:hypothetical protein